MRHLNGYVACRATWALLPVLSLSLSFVLFEFRHTHRRQVYFVRLSSSRWTTHKLEGIKSKTFLRKRQFSRSNILGFYQIVLTYPCFQSQLIFFFALPSHVFRMLFTIFVLFLYRAYFFSLSSKPTGKAESRSTIREINTRTKSSSEHRRCVLHREKECKRSVLHL